MEMAEWTTVASLQHGNKRQENVAGETPIGYVCPAAISEATILVPYL